VPGKRNGIPGVLMRLFRSPFAEDLERAKWKRADLPPIKTVKVYFL
jgi:hypothetical protein